MRKDECRMQNEQKVVATRQTPVLRYSEEPNLLRSRSGSSGYLRTGVCHLPCRAIGLYSAFVLLHSSFIISADAQSVPAAADASQGQARRVLSTQELMQSNGGSLLQAEATQESPDGTRKQAGYVDLYAVEPQQPRVLKKHDLVNIVVDEESKSQTAGTSDQQRQVDFDAKVDAFVKLNLAKLSVEGGAEGANPPEVKLEGQRDFKGTGEYDRSDTMTTRLEAEVIDVKPDGNLVIQARRHLKIDEENVMVSLTGTCRVADVDASNSISSTQLLDLDLQKTTTGQVRDTSTRGFIHRLLDIVNPF
jgi:flagellar L-ring protein FlgH